MTWPDVGRLALGLAAALILAGLAWGLLLMFAQGRGGSRSW